MYIYISHLFSPVLIKLDDMNDSDMIFKPSGFKEKCTA